MFAQGVEVADHGQRLLPIEIKSGATIAGDWFDGLERWRGWAGDVAERAYLLYGGSEVQERATATVVPWTSVGTIAQNV